MQLNLLLQNIDFLITLSRQNSKVTNVSTKSKYNNFGKVFRISNNALKMACKLYFSRIVESIPVKRFLILSENKILIKSFSKCVKAAIKVIQNFLQV